MYKPRKHIAVTCLIMCMLLCVQIAYTQDKYFTIEKGQKTFTVSSTGDSFNWFVDGVKLSETTGVYTSTWTVGNYLISILPFRAGCAGDTFYVHLEVKDNITIGGPQVMFTNSSVEVCPPSNAVPTSNEIVATVQLYGTTIDSIGQYRIYYAIDDAVPQPSEVFTKESNTLILSAAGLTTGSHLLKITRLEYGTDLNYVVDYSTSSFIPALQINVKTIPAIGEIKF